MIKTISIVVGAIVLSFAVDAIFSRLLIPDFNQLVVRIFMTPPQSKEWPDLYRQWHRATVIGAFFLAPIAGFASGIFVGIFQRRHAIAVAALSQAVLLLGFMWFDRSWWWKETFLGLVAFLGEHALPIATSMLGAMLIRKWSASSNTHDSPGATSFSTLEA